MPLLKRTTDEQASEWQPVPEGVWRWRLGKPEIRLSERFGNYQVKFLLILTDEEQDRLTEEIGRPPAGVQQSTMVSYFTGLSLGYVQRDGQYKSTKLVDFLTACLGQANGKKFRDWVVNGGGPPRPADPDDQQAELEAIGEWLGWWEDLEVYGSIRHEADSQGTGTIWARFGGPMAVGSLPGQREDDYQAMARGKLRSIVIEGNGMAEGAAKSQTRSTTDELASAVKDAARKVSRQGAVEEDDIPF